MRAVTAVPGCRCLGCRRTCSPQTPARAPLGQARGSPVPRPPMTIERSPRQLQAREAFKWKPVREASGHRLHGASANMQGHGSHLAPHGSPGQTCAVSPTSCARRRCPSWQRGTSLRGRRSRARFMHARHPVAPCFPPPGPAAPSPWSVTIQMQGSWSCSMHQSLGGPSSTLRGGWPASSSPRQCSTPVMETRGASRCAARPRPPGRAPPSRSGSSSRASSSVHISLLPSSRERKMARLSI